jgi:hypothetical protein
MGRAAVGDVSLQGILERLLDLNIATGDISIIEVSRLQGEEIVAINFSFLAPKTADNDSQQAENECALMRSTGLPCSFNPSDCRKEHE